MESEFMINPKNSIILFSSMQGFPLLQNPGSEL